MNIRIKHLLLLMVLAIAPLAACNATNSGNKAETAAEAAGDINLPLDLSFLEKIGVDVSSIIDICDEDAEYPYGFDLNEEQVLKLLPMVALMGEDELRRDYHLARARALSYIQEHPECPEVFCSISCRIGSPEILVAFYDGPNNELLSYRECVSPEEVIKHFRLREPRFAQMCRNGLFT